MHVKYDLSSDRFYVSKEPIKQDFSFRNDGIEYLRYIPIGISFEELNEYLLKSPYEACFELTNKCTYSCRTCIADSCWEKNGFLSFKGFVELLGAMPMQVCRLTLTGGEPTLHPDVKDILNYAIEEGYSVLLSTNGVNPLKIRGLIQEQDRIAIAISLHGPPNFHDEYVGHRGAFQKAVSSIEVALGFSKNVHVYSTVSRSNIVHLRELVDIVGKYPIKEHRLCLLKQSGRLKDEGVTYKEVKSALSCNKGGACLSIKRSSSPFIFVNVKGEVEVRNAT